MILGRSRVPLGRQKHEATGIQHSENAGTVTRPKLTDDAGQSSASLRSGASRWRDFAGGRETSCTLVVEKSAHLSDPWSFDNRGFGGLGCACPPSSKFARGPRIGLTQPGCQMYSGVPQVVTANGTRKGSVTSTAGWSNPVARQAHNLEVSRSNRDPATHPTQSRKRVVSAPQHESATRLASVAFRVTGSPAERWPRFAGRPGMTGGAA